MSGRIVIPIRNARGELVAYASPGAGRQAAEVQASGGISQGMGVVQRPACGSHQQQNGDCGGGLL